MLINVVRLVPDDSFTTSKRRYNIPFGSHTLGRLFFGLSDKKCSRTQAEMTVTRKSVKFVSRGVNPCGVKRKRGEEVELLKKGESTILNNGDVISLVSSKYPFEVIISKSGKEEEESEEEPMEEVESEKEKEGKNDGDNDDEEDPMEEKERRKQQRRERRESKNKRKKEEEGSDDETNKLPMCKYGAGCYRKNTDHLKKFRHPKNDDSSTRKPSSGRTVKNSGDASLLPKSKQSIQSGHSVTSTRTTKRRRDTNLKRTDTREDTDDNLKYNNNKSSPSHVPVVKKARTTAPKVIITASKEVNSNTTRASDVPNNKRRVVRKKKEEKEEEEMKIESKIQQKDVKKKKKDISNKKNNEEEKEEVDESSTSLQPIKRLKIIPRKKDDSSGELGARLLSQTLEEVDLTEEEKAERETEDHVKKRQVPRAKVKFRLTSTTIPVFSPGKRPSISFLKNTRTPPVVQFAIINNDGDKDEDGDDGDDGNSNEKGSSIKGKERDESQIGWKGTTTSRVHRNVDTSTSTKVIEENEEEKTKSNSDNNVLADKEWTKRLLKTITPEGQKLLSATIKKNETKGKKNNKNNKKKGSLIFPLLAITVHHSFDKDRASNTLKQQVKVFLEKHKEEEEIQLILVLNTEDKDLVSEFNSIDSRLKICTTSGLKTIIDSSSRVIASECNWRFKSSGSSSNLRIHEKASISSNDGHQHTLEHATKEFYATGRPGGVYPVPVPKGSDLFKEGVEWIIHCQSPNVANEKKPDYLNKDYDKAESILKELYHSMFSCWYDLL